MRDYKSAAEATSLLSSVINDRIAIESCVPPKSDGHDDNHVNSKSLCCFRTLSQVVNYLNELLLKNT